ncbi:MAG: NADH-quinone oxidoreductase subunit N, partial [Candidatus Eremiobacteraeota bacterium]|nr:NADH-quinone oxidoreductase subunit N [Candidatus Eremiobacteraeota bacterium]
GEEGAHLPAFAGLATRRPWLAASMAFFLLALAGLPPSAGFTGKILLLASMVDARYIWLAVLLILGTAISIYVYVKIIRAMYAPVDLAHVRSVQPTVYAPWIAVAICAIAVVGLGFYPIAPHDVLPLVK